MSLAGYPCIPLTPGVRVRHTPRASVGRGGRSVFTVYNGGAWARGYSRALIVRGQAKRCEIMGVGGTR